MYLDVDSPKFFPPRGRKCRKPLQNKRLRQNGHFSAPKITGYFPDIVMGPTYWTLWK